MSNEAVVRLQESRRFAVQGINEGIYESKVIEQGDLAGLQVLSTNGIEGKPVVRIPTDSTVKIQDLNINF